ncbi:MAG: hypothetical protein HYZ25_19245 [Chloroflexi bacterium]|nr:hypothetical protein [Chloroflexota bacterium]
MDFFNRLITALTVTHPLHPMIVHFPIALTGAAAFFILLALWKRSAMLEQAAFANIALASVSTLAAAATGMMDNISNYDGAAPNASIKIALATLLLILTSATAILRARNSNLFETPSSKPWYVAAYFVSFGLAAVLGFLGGVILYGF